MTEQVFVVDRAAFFGGDWPHGYVPMQPADAAPFLQRAEAAGRFVDRPTAERTPAWKQWIPYCVIRCRRPGAPPEAVFHVQRTSGTTESRLHGKRSIGIGGHIEPTDAGPDRADGGFFRRALRRELGEELRLGLPDRHEPRLAGILNDDTTSVGSVHAGLVFTLDLDLPIAVANERIEVREISKMRGGFGALADFAILWQDPGQFETWSQFLIHAGFAGPMDASDEPILPPG